MIKDSSSCSNKSSKDSKGFSITTSKLKPPFAWIGGKSRLAKDIVGLIPPHMLYVEVFGGALNVLYAKEVITKERYCEVVNDINGELINLHKMIQNRPQALHSYLNNNIKLISRELFYDIVKKRVKPRNEIERAGMYYYLISQSFGSSARTFAMNAKGCKKPKNIYRDFSKWSDRLKGVTIENKEFNELITLYDKENSFFYCDPPYVGTEKYYKDGSNIFNKEKHILLHNTIKNIKGKFLISYNDCKLIRELYKGFNIRSTKTIEYTLGKNAHKRNKRAKEVFITNY